VRVVVDTNVLISGLLWRGPPHQLIEQAKLDVFTIVTSPLLLTELDQVIRRQKFRSVLARSRIDPRRLLRHVAALAEIVEAPLLRRPVSRDPDDDRVLALALAANADLIVSGDDDLLSLRQHAGIRIVSPAEALRLIAGRA
jgi:putative PIN family toxin of toxin-antitoxin system